jgi:hypothetical protein
VQKQLNDLEANYHACTRAAGAAMEGSKRYYYLEDEVLSKLIILLEDVMVRKSW